MRSRFFDCHGSIVPRVFFAGALGFGPIGESQREGALPSADRPRALHGRAETVPE